MYLIALVKFFILFPNEKSIDNKSSNKTVNEKFKKPFLKMGRRHRAGFFDKDLTSPYAFLCSLMSIFSCVVLMLEMCVVLDLKASLTADKERAVDEPSPTDDTLEDCSSEEESIDSSMASVEIESVESEPLPDASSSSTDFEVQRQHSLA